MASEHLLRTKDDYIQHFDQQSYLDIFYSRVDGPVVFVKFVLDSLHKLYLTGQVKGTNLLEIGTGPCIYMVIPAAKWVDDITLSDISAANRDALNNWLIGRTTAHNWEPFFKHFCKLAGNTEKWQDMQNDLRQKVKRILTCDVHLSNPLHPVEMTYDVICTSLCFECASPDIPTYQKVMQNSASLLKPGGKFILMGVLNQPLCKVGSQTLKVLHLVKQDLLDAMSIAELKVLEVYEDESKSESDIAPYSGALVVMAEKTL